jgi:hypothetical protein
MIGYGQQRGLGEAAGQEQSGYSREIQQSR